MYHYTLPTTVQGTYTYTVTQQQPTCILASMRATGSTLEDGGRTDEPSLDCGVSDDGGEPPLDSALLPGEVEEDMVS